MRFYLIAFLLLLQSLHAHSQLYLTKEENIILEKSLSVRQNLRIVRGLLGRDRMPKTVSILGKSMEWNSYRFKLTGRFLLEDTILYKKETYSNEGNSWIGNDGWGTETSHRWRGMKEIEADEHHPYNHTYIFRYSVIDSLFDTADKNWLYQQALQCSSGMINYKSQFVKTVKSVSEVKEGFYIRFTRPLFSLDKKKSVVELVLGRKYLGEEDSSTDYYGTIFIIYIKDDQDEWQQFKLIDRIIL